MSGKPSYAELEQRVRELEARVLNEASQKPISQFDLLNSILSNVPASIFWKDRNSVYLGANNRFAQDTGVQNPGELIGKTDYDLAWTREEADFYRECDRRVMDSGEPMLNIEESQQQADGVQIEILTNKVPLWDPSGQVTGILGIYMDITRLKQTTAALANSERRFRVIFDSIYQLVGVLDPDGILLQANQTALDFGGLKEEDVVGRPFWDTYWWSYSEDVRNRLKAAIRDAAEGKLVRYEEDVLGANGIISTIDFTLKPVTNQYGETVLIIPEGRDITDAKRAEEELQRRRQEIAHVMRLSTMGEMASSMAHELNQPLASLVSYCGTAKSLLNSLPDLPPELGDIMERASEQAHRAGSVIRHLREFISKESDHKHPIDIDQVIEQINELLSSELKSAKVVLEHDLDRQGCKVMANKVQIEQVLVNLVRNSIEAIQGVEKNGGTITVKTRMSKNQSMEVTVVDNGPGIEADMIDEIFNPFQTSKATGMGMGLPISRSIIEDHGGRIWVDADMHGGALFGLNLPLYK